MNKKERVLAAMNGREVDHVPVGFWHHFPNPDFMDDNGAKAHLEYLRATDIDLLKIMDDAISSYPCGEIQVPEDWRNIKPMEKNDPWIERHVDRAKRITEALKDSEICTFYTVFMPFSAGRFGCEQYAPGITFADEKITRHMKEDAESVLVGLDAITESLLTLAERLVNEAGVTGLYLPLHGAEMGRFSSEEYTKWLRPVDLKMINGVNEITPNNILHCCGYSGVKNDLTLWQDYPCRVINWAAFVDELPLPEGKHFFFGRTCMAGFENTKDGILYAGTEVEVKDYTKKLITEFGKTGLILGADCTIPADIAPERIRWVAEAAREI